VGNNNYKCSNPQCSYETYIVETVTAVRTDKCPRCGSLLEKKR